MTKGKEGCSIKFLIEAVPDVDVFTVKSTTSLGAEVEECRVVLEATGKGQGKLARLKRISYQFEWTEGDSGKLKLTGLTVPKRTSAIAFPVSLPPYQACTRARAPCAQGIRTGVPL